MNPTKVEALHGKHVIGIAAGADFVLCVTDEGLVYSWGRSDFGQCGHGQKKNYSEPLQIEFEYPIKAVAAGKYHSALITDSGQLYTWGKI